MTRKHFRNFKWYVHLVLFFASLLVIVKTLMLNDIIPIYFGYQLMTILQGINLVIVFSMTCFIYPAFRYFEETDVRLEKRGLQDVIDQHDAKGVIKNSRGNFKKR